MRRGKAGGARAAALAYRPPRLSYASNMASEVRKFTRQEISSSSSESDAKLIIHNNVYQVSKFLDEHPGGHEVLMNVAGKDASEDFDDIGHSLDAKELMKKYLIGELVDEDKTSGQKSRQVNWTPAPAAEQADSDFLSSWKFPVVLGILVTVLYSYLFG